MIAAQEVEDCTEILDLLHMARYLRVSLDDVLRMPQWQYNAWDGYRTLERQARQSG